MTCLNCNSDRVVFASADWDEAPAYHCRACGAAEDDCVESLPIAPPKTTGKTPEPLTRRQVEIVRLVAEGNSNKVIAYRLGVAEQTVKNHLHRIFGKLGVQDRTSLAAFAIRSQYERTAA
jgi:DNA-binding NarL/FixJ family response regulator